MVFIYCRLIMFWGEICILLFPIYTLTIHIVDRSGDWLG